MHQLRLRRATETDKLNQIYVDIIGAYMHMRGSRNFFSGGGGGDCVDKTKTILRNPRLTTLCKIINCGFPSMPERVQLRVQSYWSCSNPLYIRCHIHADRIQWFFYRSCRVYRSDCKPCHNRRRKSQGNILKKKINESGWSTNNPLDLHYDFICEFYG